MRFEARASAGDADRLGRWRFAELTNVPVPEASLAGIAVGLVMERVQPWRLGGSWVRRCAGYGLLAVGGSVVASSVKAAGTTQLAVPDRLVTGGPYAWSRNPMYVGWMLMQLGLGLVTGSGWMVATVPMAGVWLHRDVLREERRLEEEFGDAYRSYRASVGRYVPTFRAGAPSWERRGGL